MSLDSGIQAVVARIRTEFNNSRATVKTVDTGLFGTLSGLGTYNGVALTAGDAVLVPNNIDPSKNGVYSAAAGAWTRHPAYDTSAKLARAIIRVTHSDYTGSPQVYMTDWSAKNVLGTDTMTWSILVDQIRLDAALTTKQDFVVPSDTTKWWRGDKTWADLPYNDRNLFLNADFENLTSATVFANWSTFWTAGAPTKSIETNLANVYSGTKCAKVVINAAGDTQRYGSNVMAVAPGELVTVRWYAKATNGTLETQAALLTSAATDPAPDFFASGTQSQGIQVLATTAYVLYEQVFVVPAGHTQARVYLSVNGPPGCTPGTAWIDNTAFLPESSPSGAAGHRSVTLATGPPAAPIPGELWYDTDDPGSGLDIALAAINAASGAPTYATTTFLWATLANTDYASGVTIGASYLEIVKAGVYHVEGRVRWDSNATGRRYMKIEIYQGAAAVNTGPAASEFETGALGTAQFASCSCSADVLLQAGDRLRIVVYQTSGVALALRNDFTPARLSARRVF